MDESRPRKVIPTDPFPLSPKNEAVLDGHTVTFQWEPVEGALEYRLQVAADSSFETLVLEEATAAGATFTATGRFPQDEHTLYWRVMARNDQGWSPGERIESFVSGTAEQAALNIERPDEDERYGPYPQMIKSGGVGIAAEATGRDEYYAVEEREGVEHEGVETGQIIGMALAVLVALALMILTMFLLLDNVVQSTRRQLTGISGYPELTRTEENARAKLTGYGIIDEEAGVYQLPIDRAMELVVRDARGRVGTAYSPELSLPVSTGREQAVRSTPEDLRPASGPEAAAGTNE